MDLQRSEVRLSRTCLDSNQHNEAFHSESGWKLV
jgi:hypothetical protein